MPRGVKGSGKAATVKKRAATKKESAAKRGKLVDSAAVKTPTKKARKAYPSAEERVALAEAQIERLAKINASRKILIDNTEATQKARKAALVKSTAALEKVLARKERLITGKPNVDTRRTESLSC